ncbi:hypothetical protein N7486_002249 [Penicillium sp. IBT 16267x]|nr:hypothetical protein N7486_002249 [Penicillium sp. IBT 16267x]
MESDARQSLRPIVYPEYRAHECRGELRLPVPRGIASGAATTALRAAKTSAGSQLYSAAKAWIGKISPIVSAIPLKNSSVNGSGFSTTNFWRFNFWASGIEPLSLACGFGALLLDGFGDSIRFLPLPAGVGVDGRLGDEDSSQYERGVSATTTIHF